MILLFLFVAGQHLLLISGLECHKCKVMPGVDDTCPCDTDPTFGGCTGKSRAAETVNVVDLLWSPAVTDALRQSSSSNTKKTQEACAIIVYKETGSGTLQGMARNLTRKVGADNYFPDNANCESLEAAPEGIYAWGKNMKKFRIVKSCVCLTDFCNKLVVNFTHDSKHPLLPSSDFLILCFLCVLVRSFS